MNEEYMAETLLKAYARWKAEQDSKEEHSQATRKQQKREFQHRQ